MMSGQCRMTSSDPRPAWTGCRSRIGSQHAAGAGGHVTATTVLALTAPNRDTHPATMARMVIAVPLGAATTVRSTHLPFQSCMLPSPTDDTTPCRLRRETSRAPHGGMMMMEAAFRFGGLLLHGVAR